MSIISDVCHRLRDLLDGVWGIRPITLEDRKTILEAIRLLESMDDARK